ncbi:hypothetical protein PG994_010586 [Apiospora phragmitis]|uniref:AA1-like domain-containing protein n=1 Tax=Apiospora phragmitis TaxID=2905665 RepID=A0ABR1TQE3_9PEZI
MLFSVAFVGLMASTVASTPLKYKIPANMKVAADCTMPSEYTVSNFSAYTDRSNQTTVSFTYADTATGISTHCERNPASKPHNTNPSLASRYACDDANVEFIYQATGVAGLTVIEAACPGGGGYGGVLEFAAATRWSLFSGLSSRGFRRARVDV